MNYNLGSNLCKWYAAQKAELARKRRNTRILVLVGFFAFCGAVAAFGGEELFNILGWGEL